MTSDWKTTRKQSLLNKNQQQKSHKQTAEFWITGSLLELTADFQKRLPEPRADMSGRFEENLKCPICHEIFTEPVLLLCNHNFCRTCWRRWWTENRNHTCPVCKTRSDLHDPPLNLALKNLCEDFRRDQTGRFCAEPEALCSLHSENLRLFCRIDQQPVCFVCLHSQQHKNHDFCPIDEAAAGLRATLRDLLEPLKEQQMVFKIFKDHFDQIAEDIQVHGEVAEQQIRDVFSTLQTFLQTEEKVRLEALRQEKQQKTEEVKKRSEAMSTKISALSETISSIEQNLRAADVSFLHSYSRTAQRAQQVLLEVPDQSPAGQIDLQKHHHNLASNITRKMEENISTFNRRPPETIIAPRIVLRPKFQQSDVSSSSEGNLDIPDHVLAMKALPPSLARRLPIPLPEPIPWSPGILLPMPPSLSWLTRVSLVQSTWQKLGLGSSAARLWPK